MSYFIVKSRYPTQQNYGNNGKKGNAITYRMRRNANTEAVKSFFRSLILKNEELASAKDGLYTWILKPDGTFYAGKTFTKQEIGTLHVNLDDLTRAEGEPKGNLYAAGELLLERSEMGTVHVEFNLLSGTYMAPRFKQIPEAERRNIRDAIVRDVETRLWEWKIVSAFLECSDCSEEEQLGGMKLLETATILTSPEDMALLNSMFEQSGGARSRRTLKRKKNRPLKKRV
jgi:hypothetical protein